MIKYFGREWHDAEKFKLHFLSYKGHVKKSCKFLGVGPFQHVRVVVGNDSSLLGEHDHL